MQFNLHKPIGVFDAGIGSYGMVQVIRRHYPEQDILYFADRASFPYGSKSKEELASVVSRAINTLADMGAAAVVLASNAPTIMVLNDIQGAQKVPVLGVYPPVAQALQTSTSGHVAILGVQSLINSQEIRTYVAQKSQAQPVELINASALVALVEDGSFLSDPTKTQSEVNAFVARLRHDFPSVDTCTLSSTHLPWLAPFFHTAAPDMTFLDPADELVPKLQAHTSQGSGTTICIATATDALPLSGLQQMLQLLGVDIEAHLIHNQGGNTQ